MEKNMAHQKNAAQESVTDLRAEFPSRALMAGAETWWSTVTEYQQEVGRFISDRLNKDGEAVRRTLACGNWTDAVGIQARWVEEALRDYNAEISRLTGVYAKRAALAVRDERRSS
jgi:hypothetical protein